MAVLCRFSFNVPVSNTVSVAVLCRFSFNVPVSNTVSVAVHTHLLHLEMQTSSRLGMQVLQWCYQSQCIILRSAEHNQCMPMPTKQRPRARQSGPKKPRNSKEVEFEGPAECSQCLQHFTGSEGKEMSRVKRKWTVIVKSLCYSIWH